MLSGGFRFALPTLRNYEAKEKRKRNADRRVYPTSASRDAARTNGALAYRRSTTALTVRAFGPWAQLQARLPGTRQDVRSGKLAPTGERRPRVLTRALPAPACPSPGNAPPGPVVVPVSMMPEAARSCPKLPEAARSCPKLPEAARSCPKLPEAARSCPKLPEAARMRSISFRARAPHSLHLSEYLRDRRPW